MTRTILVVDTHKSALGISAHQHARLTNSIVIAALDYPSPGRFLTELKNAKPDYILFFWRRLLLDLFGLNNSIIRSLQKSGKEIYFLVNDHLGTKEPYLKEEAQLVFRSNGYLVTNELLFQEYSTLYPNHPPLGIYRDLPDLENIERIRQENILKVKNKIVWIGNGKWGHHFGFVDHKGLRRIVIPLKSKIEKEFAQIDFTIIDSSENFLNNLDILREIASAKILIQASDSEGTGMPILEAMALGTFPITTRVGIAPEVFSRLNFQGLVAPNVDSFFKKIRSFFDSDFDSMDLIKVFDAYVESVKSSKILLRSQKDPLLNYEFKINHVILVYIRWKFRYLRNLRFMIALRRTNRHPER